MHIPIREFQLSPKKWLALLTDDGAELVNGEGEVLAHIRPSTEKSLILTRLNDIEAILSQKQPTVGGLLSTPAREDKFYELKKQLDVRETEAVKQIEPAKIFRKKCHSCFQARELFRFWEEGEDYELCAPCLQLKFGKAASKYTIPANLVEDEEPVQTVPTATVSPTYRISTECVRPTVQMCATCKFQAVTAGQKFCPKCKPKKK